MGPIRVTLDVLKLLISRLFKDSQEANMPCIVVTLDVLKLLRSRLSKDLQRSNISDISVTFEVSQPLTSKLLRELQFWNIACMVVALLVPKFGISRLVNALQSRNIYPRSLTLGADQVLQFSVLSAEQPSNIEYIPVALLVSQLLRSKDFKAVQWKKAIAMFVTFEVSIFSMFLMVVKAVHP